MAILTISGVALPAPSELNFGVMDISKDPQRNVNGTMIIERIATKRKLELTWNYLSQTELSTVLNAVKDVFFDVTYLDPETNAVRTSTFYCGDRTGGVMDVRGGVTRYKGIKFNLIER